MESKSRFVLALLAVAAALFLAGCAFTPAPPHTQASDENPSLAGTWKGSNHIGNFTIVLNADGSGSYTVATTDPSYSQAENIKKWLSKDEKKRICQNTAD